ncbi:pbuX: xanthine permease (plasmid) [Rubrobacter radiotolerans]|uniref:PbuX: xanthine permease n=2 Tax=Rubrobacter radiotolerans TaxID=42256 RepID=A0A023X6X7_RUBRA|nr:2-oxo-4-hydroxy-4-carboxy-5-ureidoimidazoline decarboxylase [Rubrobacter radiotolerans]AHY48202.1 pbuX: xanthine permease [Rubrobacter radiotolerans]SMC01858.1 OHCU decarboxylase [Rubrobacter radiotolerans DSM 5868]
MSGITSSPGEGLRESVHQVDEVLPPAKMAVYGFQHLLSFYAGFVVAPLLVAAGIGLTQEQTVYVISASLLACGIATLLQCVGIWEVGIRLPVVLGTTITAVGPMIAIGNTSGGGVDGLLAIYGAVIVSGIATLLFAPYYSRLIRFFPPVVTGTVITIIGISLLPVAVSLMGGGDPEAANFGSLQNLLLAGGTLAFIVAIYRVFPGFLSTIAILLGLVVGTAAASLLGIVDFGGVGEARWVQAVVPFHFGWPTFGLAAILSMLVVMLITAVETTGDVFAVGDIVEKPIRRKGIARAIRADGLGTAIGGILNSFPVTTFAGNIGLVRLTRVRSRWVVATAGVFMIAIGFLPKLPAVFAAIPPAVIGAATLALFGTIAVVGIQILSRVDFREESNLVVVAISLGIAIIPISFPEFFADVPEELQIVLGSGIILGTLSAISLNILFNVLAGKKNLVEEVVPTPRAPENLTLGQVNELDREEFARKFRPLYQGNDRIAREAFEEHPFASLYDLRRAFQDVLFASPPERQLELIRTYPDLGTIISMNQAPADSGFSPKEHEIIRSATMWGMLSPESRREQTFAGLNRLSQEEYEAFARMNQAYREKFGFPLIVCVRENTKETILASGKDRLKNSPTQEKATALVEIAKIANLRLLELVEEPADEVVSSMSR